MAKMNRERAVKEKRALKQEKKEARKQAAAEARNGETPETTIAEDAPLDPLASDDDAAMSRPSPRERSSDTLAG